VVTLNRPDQLNAVTPAMLDQLREIFLEADEDDRVRVVVVTGSGRAFCAGADLSEGPSRFDFRSTRAEAYRDKGGTVTLAAHACRKPIFGAINGAAVGFGASFQLAFDARLASTKARIAFLYARRGIVPEGVSSWFLPRLVGVGAALEWMSTGRLVGADEGHATGLFRSVHQPDELMPAVLSLAREIVENTSGVSVAAARRMVWMGLAAAEPARKPTRLAANRYPRPRSQATRGSYAGLLTIRVSAKALTVLGTRLLRTAPLLVTGASPVVPGQPFASGSASPRAIQV